VVQAFASIEQGTWYARSPEVIHSKLVETLVWMRVPGDVVFGAGAFTLAAFAAKLLLSRGRKETTLQPASAPLAAE
jgi:nitric oxide reductase subunit B